MARHKTVDGKTVPFTTDEEEEWDAREAADAARIAADSAEAPRRAIKAQIATLEASCTERRWREAALTDAGKAWMANVDSQITALRAQLS